MNHSQTPRIAMLMVAALAVVGPNPVEAQTVATSTVAPPLAPACQGCRPSPVSGVVIRDASGNIISGFGGIQETFQLATSNVASSAATLYGGDYLLSQVCSGYGTVALKVVGPDGTSLLTMATYSTADTTTAHAFAFGSYAKVSVVLTGTTGCNVLISRVPS